ncbi:MAG: hydroxymethylbilane synthase [Firmicutes bacterium]|nr:hydroxymethylbilane synthase [Bacillota bacterium]
MKIKVGSRESALAVIQSEMLMDAIREADDSIELELVTMKTKGDKILDRNLDKIGGKGLFIKELEIALAAEEVDLVVHCVKDMTMDVSEELPVLACSVREDPRDALILPEGVTELDLSKPIGCSSNRRIIQLKQLYPEATFEPMRGNVQTRLAKVDSGHFAATLLAVAGLKRAGLEHRISRIFEPDEMIPSAGQGVLAVQGRAGQDTSFLKGFDDRDAWRSSLCERSFVRTLNGGCTSPIAAYASIDGDKIKLTGMDIDKDGNPVVLSCEAVAVTDEECVALGHSLALQMKGKTQ